MPEIAKKNSSEDNFRSPLKLIQEYLGGIMGKSCFLKWNYAWYVYMQIGIMGTYQYLQEICSKLSMDHTNRRCATNNCCIGKFLNIRNCETSEKKNSELWDLSIFPDSELWDLFFWNISRFGIVRLIFRSYKDFWKKSELWDLFLIRNCETYFSEVWNSPLRSIQKTLKCKWRQLDFKVFLRPRLVFLYAPFST
jgi:hypothetical protein